MHLLRRVLLAFTVLRSACSFAADGQHDGGSDGGSGISHLSSGKHVLVRRQNTDSSLISDAHVQRPRRLHIFTIYNQQFEPFLKVWRACLSKSIEDPASVTVEAVLLPSPQAPFWCQWINLGCAVNVPQTSLLQAGHTQERTRLTPRGMVQFVMDSWISRASVGDTLKSDTDVFVMKDVMTEMVNKFRDYDIVASVDCVAQDRNGSSWCEWYVNRNYTVRHRGRDPLADVGFMLNTGLIYLKSSAPILSLLNDTRELSREGALEQLAFNEVLLQWRCDWRFENGALAPRGHDAFAALRTQLLYGTCAGPSLAQLPKPLTVVVLPYAVVPRVRHGEEGDMGPDSIAYHPGPTTLDKLQQLPWIARKCGMEERHAS